MRLLLFAVVLLTAPFCRQVSAGQKSVTYFLDGARVVQEVAAASGYLEVALPDNLMPGSLRVKAVGGSVVRVELVPAEKDLRRAREIARLRERKGELQDRMAALEKREEIFSAAAKSQSGKAPRKTKANPDPLGTLQQGTEFALARMETVYRSKRKCRRELEGVEKELAAASKGVASARIWISGGKARVSFLVRDEFWTPSYDLRWNGEEGELLLHAKLPSRGKGVSSLVARGTMEQGGTTEAVKGEFPLLSRWPLKLLSKGGTGDPPTTFVFGAVEAGLPPGEAALYWKGEYLGRGRFAGGGATEFSIGRE